MLTMPYRNRVAQSTNNVDTCYSIFSETSCLPSAVLLLFTIVLTNRFYNISGLDFIVLFVQAESAILRLKHKCIWTKANGLKSP